ncbi:MAG: hypothetical protein LBQ18_00245 [Campylobacteraceae bacterium]|nr:hypothetical protein [Campylobacteraceae bacterium]
MNGYIILPIPLKADTSIFIKPLKKQDRLHFLSSPLTSSVFVYFAPCLSSVIKSVNPSRDSGILNHTHYFKRRNLWSF